MYNSFISFYHNVLSVTRAIFLSFSLVILQKKFCTVLPYRKFSYFVQFYIFTLAILLYNFLPQCLSVTWAIFKFSSFVFFIEINSH